MPALREAEPEAPTADVRSTPPGSLGIRERRSWATWQLVASSFLTLVVGMMIAHSGESGSAAGGGGAGGVAGQPAFRLPPTGGAAGGAALPPPTSLAGGAPGGAVGGVSSDAGSGSSSAGASSPTTVEQGGAGSGGSSASAEVLMPRVSGAGPRVLPEFRAEGEWKIGWAFRCTGAGSFQVIVVSGVGQTPDSAAVDQQGQGQGVTAQSATGQQHLEVRTDGGCRWVVKVTSA